MSSLGMENTALEIDGSTNNPVSLSNFYVGRHIENQSDFKMATVAASENRSAPIFERNLPLLNSNTHTAKMHLIGQAKPFSKLTKSNFKTTAVAATLKIAARQFSKGPFLYSTPTHPAKMDLTGQGVLLEIDGNKKLTDARTTPVTTIPLSPIWAEG